MPLLLLPLKLYKLLLSPLLGCNCRFLPSCADYAQEAIARHGALKGGGLTLKRLLRCHPFGAHGMDAVP